MGYVYGILASLRQYLSHATVKGAFAPVPVKKYPDLLATVYVWDFEHRFYFVVRNKRTRKVLGVSNDLFRDYNRSVEENASEIVDALRGYCGEVVFGGWHPKKRVNDN